MSVVNFYNPCNTLSVELMDELAEHLRGKVICCGDLSALSRLWENCNDDNGMVIEELMESKNLAILNDRRGTRIYIRTGTESTIDFMP